MPEQFNFLQNYFTLKNNSLLISLTKLTLFRLQLESSSNHLNVYAVVFQYHHFSILYKKVKLLFNESHLKYVNVKRITLEKSLRELKTLTDSHRKNSSRIQQLSCSHSCHLYFYHTLKQKQIAIKVSSKHPPPPANSVQFEIPMAQAKTRKNPLLFFFKAYLE